MPQFDVIRRECGIGGCKAKIEGRTPELFEQFRALHEKRVHGDLVKRRAEYYEDHRQRLADAHRIARGG